MDSYSYRIDRRPSRMGGGWRLQLLQNGVEVAAEVFTTEAGTERVQRRAYAAALARAKEWLAAHRESRG